MAHADLGALLEEQGRPPRRPSISRRAIEAARIRVWIWEELGRLLLHFAPAHAGEWGAPEKRCLPYAAPRHRPKDAEVRNALGKALAVNGEMKEAVVEFQEAVRLNPADANARENLQRARAMMGGQAR